jgi:hypothetical protein
MTPNQRHDASDKQRLDALAAELRRESDRLRELAAELQQTGIAQAEMRTSYAQLRAMVFVLLRDKFERELPPLPDKDLPAVALEEGALPLEAFIHELERGAEGPNP